MRSASAQILEVNCMSLSQRSPTGLLLYLGKLAQERLGTSASCPPLSQSGTSAALIGAVAARLAKFGSSFVIIADEVDQLLGKRSATNGGAVGAGLEAVFALVHAAGGPAVAFVAIANAVDLLERSSSVLQEASRCESLLFQPYSAEQLRSIFKARLSADGASGQDAEKALGPVQIELTVRQVAKRSGDCRQVVRLCEQARFEAAARSMAEEEAGNTPAAGPSTPQKKLKPSSLADPLASVGLLPPEQQVLLCALASAKGEAMKFLDICARYKDCLKQVHLSPVGSKEQVMTYLSVLEQRGLLDIRAAKRTAAAAGRRSAAGPLGGRSMGSGAESIIELAVSCKAVRESLVRANHMLEKCLA